MYIQAANPLVRLIAILDPQDGKEVAVDLPAESAETSSLWAAPVGSGSRPREG